MNSGAIFIFLIPFSTSIFPSSMRHSKSWVFSSGATDTPLFVFLWPICLATFHYAFYRSTRFSEASNTSTSHTPLFYSEHPFTMFSSQPYRRIDHRYDSPKISLIMRLRLLLVIYAPSFINIAQVWFDSDFPHWGLWCW